MAPARRDAKHEPRLHLQPARVGGPGPRAIEQLGIQTPLCQEQVLGAAAVKVSAPDDGGGGELQVLEEVDRPATVLQDRGLAPVIGEQGAQRLQLRGRPAQGTAA